MPRIETKERLSLSAVSPPVCRGFILAATRGERGVEVQRIPILGIVTYTCTSYERESEGAGSTEEATGQPHESLVRKGFRYAGVEHGISPVFLEYFGVEGLPTLEILRDSVLHRTETPYEVVWCDWPVDQDERRLALFEESVRVEAVRHQARQSAKVESGRKFLTSDRQQNM